MTVDNPTVAEMISDPAWEFATNPTKAVEHATTRAATAWERGDRVEARRFASMASELVAIADSPHVEVGLVVESILSQPR